MYNFRKATRSVMLLAVVFALALVFTQSIWAIEPGDVVYEDGCHKIVYMGPPESEPEGGVGAVNITALYPEQPSYQKGTDATVVCEYDVYKPIAEQQSHLRIRLSFVDDWSTGWLAWPEEPGHYMWSWGFGIPPDAKSGIALAIWILQSKSAWGLGWNWTTFGVVD